MLVKSWIIPCVEVLFVSVFGLDGWICSMYFHSFEFLLKSFLLTYIGTGMLTPRARSTTCKENESGRGASRMSGSKGKR